MKYRLENMNAMNETWVLPTFTECLSKVMSLRGGNHVEVVGHPDGLWVIKWKGMSYSVVEIQ